ncbi:hypothetical protein [uncultured Methylobacterium sp.]|uniref:hypothetical protein n=1 Tax=uncultured Methylobacterium sp. TaxID=157278 RepID=UPI0035CA7E6F
MRNVATLVFTGRFRPDSFRAFAEHRARLLDLSVRAEGGPERVVVEVAGQGDCVDAFEMACSLGPIDCLVRDVERRDDAPAPTEESLRDE